jgi:hypothetical protein
MQLTIPRTKVSVQGGGGGWEVRYHIADYAEKIKMVAV